jgi:hypothetical protein
MQSKSKITGSSDTLTGQIRELSVYFTRTFHNCDISEKMITSDARLKYSKAVLIIDFGPDDEVLKQNDATLFY